MVPITLDFFLSHFFQVEGKLVSLDAKQMDVMMRLMNLSKEVEALKNKTEQNRQMAIEAKALADNATDLTSSLEQVRLLVEFGPKLLKK